MAGVAFRSNLAPLLRCGIFYIFVEFQESSIRTLHVVWSKPKDLHLSLSTFACCHGVLSYVYTSYYLAKSPGALLRFLVFSSHIASSSLEFQVTISILLKLLGFQPLSSQISETVMICFKPTLPTPGSRL